LRPTAGVYKLFRVMASSADDLRAVEDRILRAFAAEDAEAIAAEYTEDAVLMPPGQPAVAGRAAIAGLYRGFFAQFRLVLETTVEEAEVAGDLGFLRGRLRQEIHPRAGPGFLRGLIRRRAGGPEVQTGKFLAVLRREADGAWRFSRDIFNTDR
jgi:uncharacterized protein (TIGR02246 family)